MSLLISPERDPAFCDGNAVYGSVFLELNERYVGGHAAERLTHAEV